MKVTSESFDLIVKYILRLCSIWHDFGVVLPVVLYIISSPFYMNCRMKKRTLSTQWIRQYTRLFYVKIINAIIDIYSLSHTYIATLLLRMEYIHMRGNDGCELLYLSRERDKCTFFISCSEMTVEDSRMDNTLHVAVRTFNRSFQPFLAR